MIVKAIYKDKKYDYFRDKTTAEKVEEQVKRVYGDIFECDDELAEERIQKGLVKKASQKEEKEYLKQHEELEKSQEGLSDDTSQNNDKESENEVVNYDEMTDDELLSLALSKGIRIEPDKFNRDEILNILNNPLKEGESNEE